MKGVIKDFNKCFLRYKSNSDFTVLNFYSKYTNNSFLKRDENYM